MKKVIYCPKCKSWFSGDSDTNNCPDCNVLAQFVDVDYSTYKAMSEEEKSAFKTQYLLEHEKEINDAQEQLNANQLQLLITQMAADLHFIKTVVLVFVVLFVAVQFIMLINLA